MSKSNVIELAGRDERQDPLTDMLRFGAQQLIQQAVEAELQHLLVQHAGNRTSAGTAGVFRNGYLPARDLQTSLGPIPVRIPKVRFRTGEAVTSDRHWCRRISARQERWKQPCPGCI